MREADMSLTAPVFNVQTYSIHDGPGIRVTVFLKGCPLRCIWCANPESNLSSPQLMTYHSKCTGCGACVSACSKGAISMREEDGKILEFTDRSLCVNCGGCISLCHAQAREIAGELKTVAEVMEKVRGDKMFMDASGGGMTISGGECLMHPDFSEALLLAAKSEGIHTAVESCCFAPRKVIGQVFRNVDLALLDLKHMDSAKHKEYTGVPNEQILENISYIHRELKVPVIIRVPTIPGCNDSEENIAATAKFAAELLGEAAEMHLLPYHRLGESKNESLGKEPRLNIEVPDNAHMEHLKSIAEGFGVKVQIGG